MSCATGPNLLCLSLSILIGGLDFHKSSIPSQDVDTTSDQRLVRVSATSPPNRIKKIEPSVNQCSPSRRYPSEAWWDPVLACPSSAILKAICVVSVTEGDGWTIIMMWCYSWSSLILYWYLAVGWAWALQVKRPDTQTHDIMKNIISKFQSGNHPLIWEMRQSPRQGFSWRIKKSKQFGFLNIGMLQKSCEVQWVVQLYIAISLNLENDLLWDITLVMSHNVMW